MHDRFDTWKTRQKIVQRIQQFQASDYDQVIGKGHVSLFKIIKSFPFFTIPRTDQNPPNGTQEFSTHKITRYILLSSPTQAKSNTFSGIEICPNLLQKSLFLKISSLISRF